MVESKLAFFTNIHTMKSEFANIKKLLKKLEVDNLLFLTTCLPTVVVTLTHTNVSVEGVLHDKLKVDARKGASPRNLLHVAQTKPEDFSYRVN